MTRILSLDDCPQMSDLIGLIIERVAGYNLWAANDSYEAWALLHTLSFDLLIQDTLRPDIDGRDFFRLVRADARLDNVPVLMATAVSRKQNRAALINAGVDGYVTKPFAPQELMAAVQDVLLHKNKPVPPKIDWKKLTSPDEYRAALSDPDSKVRRLGLVGWGWGECKGGWPIEPPIQALADPEAEVRLVAIKTLKRLKNRRAVEPLTALLADQEIEVRQAAIQALGILGDKRAVEPLVERLGGSDSASRWAAALALGRLKARKAIEPLLAALDDESALVRIMATLGLGRIGANQAVAPLKEMLADGDAWVHQAAALALNQLGHPGATEPYRRIGQ